MPRRRWARWLAPPLVIGAIALALSQLHAGAEAGGRKTAPPIGACAASPVVRDAAGKPRRDVGPGSWWTLGDRLDSHGSMTGRHLAVGHGGTTTFALDLPVESLASGPTGGVVVLAADDGQRSTLDLVSAEGSCSFEIGRSQDVIRGAILDPSNGSVLAHLVGRATRADLGTWRFGVPGSLGDPVFVAPAIGAALDGPAWVTDLRLDSTARFLAIQSCTDAGCLTRVFDLQTPAAPVVLGSAHPDQSGTGQGSMLGFANGSLLTWAACAGYPCQVLAWNLQTGVASTIFERADGAAVTRDGRFLVVSTDVTKGMTARVDLVRGGAVLLRGVQPGELPLAGGVTATSGVQLAADEVAIGARGATPHAFRPAAAEVIP